MPVDHRYGIGKQCIVVKVLCEQAAVFVDLTVHAVDQIIVVVSPNALQDRVIDLRSRDIDPRVDVLVEGLQRFKVDRADILFRDLRLLVVQQRHRLLGDRLR